MKRTFTSLAVLLLCSTPLFAQKKWNLEECVQYAQDNNLQVKLSELDIRSNQNALKTSEFARYPNLNAGANHTYNWGRSFDPLTNQPISERVQTNGFQISSNATLYNFGRIQTTIQQNKVNLEASRLDVQQQKNDISLNIANAYLQILFSMELVENAKRQLKNTQDQYQLTKKQVDAGVLPKANLFDLESQIATNELAVVNQENTLAIRYLQLEQLMQLPNDDEFEVEVPSIPEPPSQLSLETAEAIYQTALGNQPNIQSAALGIKSAELQKKIAEADKYPSLSVSAGINTRYSSAQDQIPDGTRLLSEQELADLSPELNGFIFADPDSPTGGADPIPIYQNPSPVVNEFKEATFFNQLSEGYNPFIQFGIDIPIFNRNQVNNGIENAQILAERARLNKMVTENTLRQNIESAYLDVIAASKTYESNKKQVTALEEQYRVTKKQFDAGAGNSVDYQIAENNLFNAKSDLLRGKYDYVFKMKILDFYMGREIKL